MSLLDVFGGIFVLCVAGPILVKVLWINWSLWREK